jgi:hypothetical protein
MMRAPSSAPFRGKQSMWLFKRPIQEVWGYAIEAARNHLLKQQKASRDQG